MKIPNFFTFFCFGRPRASVAAGLSRIKVLQQKSVKKITKKILKKVSRNLLTFLLEYVIL